MPGVKGRSGGRNRKSIRQHVLEGTVRQSRHAGVRNPTPAAGTPKRPAPLAGQGRRAWKRLTKLLGGSELLTVVDGDMLYAYCALFAAIQDINKSLRRLDVLPIRKLTASERLKREDLRSRLIAQRRSHLQATRAFLVEFGLSPAARNRIDLSVAGAGIGETSGTTDDMSEFDHAPELKLVHDADRS